MIAIAAMSLNRAIGAGGQIPWHLSEDLKFFKRTTLGHTVVMGRKTYESIGRPLPGRENIVLTRGAAIPGVTTIRDPGQIPGACGGSEIFVIGGSQIYELLLPRCAAVLLTLVKIEVEGDAFLPVFEPDFPIRETLEDTPGFARYRYRRV